MPDGAHALMISPRICGPVPVGTGTGSKSLETNTVPGFEDQRDNQTPTLGVRFRSPHAHRGPGRRAVAQHGDDGRHRRRSNRRRRHGRQSVRSQHGHGRGARRHVRRGRLGDRAALADRRLQSHGRQGGLHRRERDRPDACAPAKPRPSRSSSSPPAARAKSPSTARRRACAPTRRSATIDSPAVDETPILGRKVTTLAALQLGVPPGERHRRPVRERDVLHHRRGQPPHDHVMLDGANNDEGWGRQTMIATVPMGAVQEVTGAVERVFGRVRLDGRARRSTS